MLQKLKEKRKQAAQGIVVWQHRAFTNPARKDGLQVCAVAPPWVRTHQKPSCCTRQALSASVRCARPRTRQQFLPHLCRGRNRSNGRCVQLYHWVKCNKDNAGNIKPVDSGEYQFAKYNKKVSPVRPYSQRSAWRGICAYKPGQLVRLQVLAPPILQLDLLLMQCSNQCSCRVFR